MNFGYYLKCLLGALSETKALDDFTQLLKKIGLRKKTLPIRYVTNKLLHYDGYS